MSTAGLRQRQHFLAPGERPSWHLGLMSGLLFEPTTKKRLNKLCVSSWFLNRKTLRTGD